MHFELSSFADFHLRTNTAFKTADLRILKIRGDKNYKITLPKKYFYTFMKSTGLYLGDI